MPPSPWNHHTVGALTTWGSDPPTVTLYAPRGSDFGSVTITDVSLTDAGVSVSETGGDEDWLTTVMLTVHGLTQAPDVANSNVSPGATGDEDHKIMGGEETSSDVVL